MLATLIRLLGDFDLAEDALQDAFAVALSTGRARACRAIRAPGWSPTARRKAHRPAAPRRALRRRSRTEIAPAAMPPAEPDDGRRRPAFPDDRLRLIFTCCHPALAPEAQVALTLQTLCGLETEEIARAFLVPAPTMAQRLVRAKAKIRDARHPVRGARDRAELPERLDGVLRSSTCVFNEGYAATAGERARAARALRRGDPPGTPAARAAAARAARSAGLLALMLLHDSRRDGASTPRATSSRSRSRTARAGTRRQIAEGAAARRGGAAPGGAGLLRAAGGDRRRSTPRRRARGRHRLARRSPRSTRCCCACTPRRWSRSTARWRWRWPTGPSAAWPCSRELEDAGRLAGFHLLPAARADLLRRLGRRGEAAAAYAQALEDATSAVERRYLECLRREMEAS